MSLPLDMRLSYLCAGRPPIRLWSTQVRPSFVISRALLHMCLTFEMRVENVGKIWKRGSVWNVAVHMQCILDIDALVVSAFKLHVHCSQKKFLFGT